MPTRKRRSASSPAGPPALTRQTRPRRARQNPGEKGHEVLVSVVSSAVVPLVTPETCQSGRENANTVDDVDNVRRTLFASPSRTVAVTPTRDTVHAPKSPPSPVQRKLFGRSVSTAEVEVLESTRRVYSIVKKLTGSIGGNGSFGPIYGELTMGSMQKMINLCKQHAELDSTSRFIDVGSGIGKPNLHVAQDPGVSFSLGIEVEPDRWLLGMNCLKGVLDAKSAEPPNETDDIGHRCMFIHGDITQAKTFNPFSHVYMFSIGFPPLLWCELSDMWNCSASVYLICYHGPKSIIDQYEFNVKLVVQTPTSMHGSKEGHTGYIYRRTKDSRRSTRPLASTDCDALFAPALDLVERGNFNVLQQHVDMLVGERMNPCGPLTRSKKL